MFITWRLSGSLPTGRKFYQALTSGQAFVVMDRILEKGSSGPLYLGRPEIADMVVAAIHDQETELRHYELHAYVVMPNHVHILITPCVEVSKLMMSLKRFTAREGNRMLGLTGKAFWAEESYDRLVRDAEEFRRIENYIEHNPVKAGLVKEPEDFHWSNAFWRVTNPPQAASLPYYG